MFCGCVCVCHMHQHWQGFAVTSSVPWDPRFEPGFEPGTFGPNVCTLTVCPALDWKSVFFMISRQRKKWLYACRLDPLGKKWYAADLELSTCCIRDQDANHCPYCCLKNDAALHICLQNEFPCLYSMHLLYRFGVEHITATRFEHGIFGKATTLSHCPNSSWIIVWVKEKHWQLLA